jgi:hypothetical protein
MGRKYSTDWNKMNAYRILVGKSERKRRLGRTRLGDWTILKWILEI